MSKFKLTQTAAEVQDILNNSLQKPTGLSKTKLVGVGVNGQENIEIGDNLTLANGKLSSAAAGGGGSGTPRHVYSIYISSRRSSSDIVPYSSFHYEVYTTKDYQLEKGKATEIENFVDSNYDELRSVGLYTAGGYYSNNVSNNYIVVSQLEIMKPNRYRIWGYLPLSKEFSFAQISGIVGATATVEVVQNF